MEIKKSWLLFFEKTVSSLKTKNALLYFVHKNELMVKNKRKIKMLFILIAKSAKTLDS